MVRPTAGGALELTRSLVRLSCSLCPAEAGTYDTSELTRVTIVDPERRTPRVAHLCPAHARALASWWYGGAEHLPSCGPLEVVDAAELGREGGSTW